MEFPESGRFLKGRDRAMEDPRFGDPRWSPAGFVFMATQRDVDVQLKTLLFGYPRTGWGIVRKIIKGTPIFLFDMHHQVSSLFAPLSLVNISKTQHLKIFLCQLHLAVCHVNMPQVFKTLQSKLCSQIAGLKSLVYMSILHL